LALYFSNSSLLKLYNQDSEFDQVGYEYLAQSIEKGWRIAHDKTKFVTFYKQNNETEFNYISCD
jgi:hypothetical protein